MIPNIALMIGSYVGFRMIEVLLMPNSHYGGDKRAVAAKILAVLAFLVSSFACLDTLMTGSSVPLVH